MSTLERQLLDQVEQMILVVEPDSLRIAMVNRVAVEILGYAREELLEKTILDIECALQDVFYWEEVRYGQRSNIDSQEGLYTCADGSMYSAIKSVRSVVLDDKSFLLVQAREIPRGLSIEEDLAYTTSQLRATLESTGNGILVIDWQGRISSMNRLFSTMWQLPEDLLLTHDEQAHRREVGRVHVHVAAHAAVHPVHRIRERPHGRHGRHHQRVPRRLRHPSLGHVWTPPCPPGSIAENR